MDFLQKHCSRHRLPLLRFDGAAAASPSAVASMLNPLRRGRYGFGVGWDGYSGYEAPLVLGVEQNPGCALRTRSRPVESQGEVRVVAQHRYSTTQEGDRVHS